MICPTFSLRITIVLNILLLVPCFVASLSPASAGETDYINERPPYAGVWVNTFGKAYDFSPYHHFLGGGSWPAHVAQTSNGSGYIQFC